MNRLLVLVMLFVLVLSIFVACNNQGVSQLGTQDKFFYGYTIDNLTPISNLIKNMYEIKELQEYFGFIPPNESVMYGLLDNNQQLTINDINERFPVECIRCTKNMVYYSVYRVSEGGFFYVFWAVNIGTSKTENDSIRAYFTTYISSLKKATDFNLVKEGISTAEDIAQIDSALELTFVMSSGIRSFSRLEDGTILEIQYKRCEEIQTRKDLVVESMRILPEEIAQTSSYLACITPEDLP